MPRAGSAVAQTVAQIAALDSWARTHDRSARTQAARDARWQKYIERATELAPEGASTEDIEYRANCLRQADMKRMALASMRARKGGGDPDAA